jgi:hypothetical protein
MMIEIRYVLDQHALLDFYSANSLKQQSADGYVAPLRHIVLIPSQSVFVLSPYKCCVLNGEATNKNVIVFGLTWSIHLTQIQQSLDTYYLYNNVSKIFMEYIIWTCKPIPICL